MSNMMLAKDAIKEAITYLEQVPPRNPDLARLWAEHLKQDLTLLSLLAQREEPGG